MRRKVNFSCRGLGLERRISCTLQSLQRTVFRPKFRLWGGRTRRMCAPRSGGICGIVLPDDLDFCARRCSRILVLPWVMASCAPNAYGHIGGEKRQANWAYWKHRDGHCFLFPMTTYAWESLFYAHKSSVTTAACRIAARAGCRTASTLNLIGNYPHA